MREIEFRGISLITNDFVYGSLVMYNPIPEITDCTIGENNYEYHSEEIDPKTIGQFIGIKDRNGKKIYEGDILDNDWTVSFKDGMFGIFDKNHHMGFNSYMAQYREVVKNIHQL